MFKKLMAASLAAVMTVSFAGCGEKTEPTDGSTAAPSDSASAPTTDGSTSAPVEEGLGAYTIINDPATGKPYDLGGMEIIIRDWWSPEEAAEPNGAFEEARAEYREWIQETYNFKIRELGMGDWGSNPQDFVDYVTTDGDDVNYVFTLRADPAITSAMGNNLMYDWASLDCIDLSESKWQKNKLHEKYTFQGKVAAVNAGYPEPRCGIYFNKRLLTDAGIDPESIYDLQASGDWTWSAWTDMMAKVQRDINNDGQIDVYGFDANYGIPVSAAVASNNSEYVGSDNGTFVYKFEDPATVEALEWMVENFKNYALVRPADAQWDYYKEAFKNGQVAFMPDEAYCGGPNGFLMDMVDEIGFVAFPKGPQATDYTNWWNDNLKAIPACYDEDRAWKIAFAYNLWTEDTPGYEDELDLSAYRNYNFDSRAVDETIVMMSSKGSITYHDSIPDLDMGAPFLYNFGSWTVVSEVLDGVRDSYKAYIDAANGK